MKMASPNASAVYKRQFFLNVAFMPAMLILLRAIL
jgi:hypothetical protein